ncbi:MAG: septum formation inhibitor Maf [Flavobacteriaceae bacterium]
MKKLLLLFLLTPFIGMAQLSQTFKNHWFDGFAEISSYELTQSRYGQQRIGKAVLIFVTEDFLAKEQVKANQKSKTTIPVLKSNRTKNFLTGIYPYSIMSSSFSSLRKKHPLIKTVASIQEWCGQSYLQLNAREKENTLISHSYFEGVADQTLTIPNKICVVELWNLIRFNPKNLPVGEFDLLPSLEIIRLNHIEPKAVKATASLQAGNYTLYIPSLQRSLSIQFDPNFPYTIEGWEEKYDYKAEQYASTAKRIHTERRQYWQENNNASVRFRAPFKLD